MAGTLVDLEINDTGFRDVIKTLNRRFSDLTPPAIKVIAATIRASVIRNFEKGGRPSPWKPLSPVTLARRKGKKKRILMRQGFVGGPADSIHTEAESNKAIVRTKKIYAAVHQFDAKKGLFEEFKVKIRAHCFLHSL